MAGLLFALLNLHQEVQDSLHLVRGEKELDRTSPMREQAC